MCIIPTEDNCVVEVTPTASAFGFIFGVATRDHSPGVIARSRPLRRYFVIFLSTEADLPGTKVNKSCYLSVITVTCIRLFQHTVPVDGLYVLEHNFVCILYFGLLLKNIVLYFIMQSAEWVLAVVFRL